jgi:hypothetical protein
MSNIIPFESGKLPSYLAKLNPADFNADLTAHAGGGFPVISIKGKVFAIVRDGERKVLPNPKDPDSPATAIDVVLLKVNKGTSKVFYAKGYVEGSDGVKPDCFSNTGVRPDASIENPQSKTCATCPHNQWGSKISESGSKGKACQDSVRIAVATPNQVNEPYLLRVPPASIRALGEYGQMLAKRNVAYNMVVTKVGFDMEAPNPKLTFKPVGILDEPTFLQVQDAINSDVVAQITGVAPVGAPLLGDPEVQMDAPAVESEEPKPAPVEAKKPAKKAEAKPKAEEVEVDGFNLDGLDFDD